jgi:PAS domain S-box-containing protein
MSSETTKLLLIEDNPGDARLICEILSEVGKGAFELLAADTLSSGLEMLRAQRVDAVLLDLSLPDSHGYDTFAQVYSAAPHAAVIMLTGLNDEITAREMVSAGAQDYLVKGHVEGELLWRTIRFAIERKRMETRLQASEQRYGTLANAMPQMVWASDVNGDHFYYNQRWYEYTGLSEEESLGFGFTNALHPDDKERTLQRWKRAWQDGESYEIEYRFYSRPRGKYRWFLGRAMPVRDDSGKIIQWVGTCTDIDDQKRAEEALRQSEDRYRDLVENSQDLICTHDLAGQILSVNKCAAKLLGYDQRLLVGKSLRDIIPLEFHDKFTLYLDQMKSEGAHRGLMTVQTVTGKRRVWEFNNTLRSEGVAEPVVRGMARDVTEWVLAEASLRQSEKDYRCLFEQAHDAILVFDPEGEVVLDVNERACEMYGFSRAEFIGMSLERISKDVARGKSQLEETLRKGDYLNFQTNQYRKDGSEITLEINAAAIEYKGRRAILSINRDITERQQADQKLQKREAQLREAQTLAHLGSWEFELASGKVTWSDELYRIWGITPEEFDGTYECVRQLFHPADRETLHNLVETALHQHESYVFEHRIVRPAGEVRILQSRGAVVLDEGGQVVRLIGTAQDITERKRAEDALQKNFNILNGIIEGTPDPVFVKDIEGRYVHVNSSGAQLLSKSQAEVIGRSDEELFPQDEARRIKEDDRRVLAAGRAQTYDEVVIAAEGRSVYLSTTKAPYRDSEGKIIGLVGISRDFTERKRAEELIREADQRALQEYERLLDRIASLAQLLGKARDLLTVYRALQGFAAASTPRSGVFIWLYDPKRNLRETAYAWSEGEEVDVLGLPPMPINESPNSRAVLTGEVIITNDFQAATAGLPVTHVGMERDPRLPQSSLVAPMAVMGRVIGAIEVQSTTLEAFNQGHATAMRMAANLAAVAIENVRLLERERSQEEQLRQAQKMEAVGHLAGGVAHDFNNLVTAIIGYSTLALRRLDPADEKEALLRRQIEEVKKAGERAAGLTHQLLAFSRKQILQPKILNLNDTVAEISKMLRRLIGEDIDLVLRLDPDLGMVKADPTQVEQIIMNLAVNARDAMPKGGTLVIETENVFIDERIANRHYSADIGPHVRLTVSDTGTGIDKETLQHVFEPFFTTKGVGKGTGLGLSTVYGIVNQSGGYISVYSEVGHGSTFKIYLPRVDKESKVKETVDVKIAGGSETILLVEDEDLVRGITRTMLEEFGYKVLETRSAKEALQVCKEHAGQIHLMLTDVVMPQMGGKALSEQVKVLRSDTGILYMSGYTDDMIVHHGVLEQGTPFLQKPFTPDALARKVREVLDVRD